MSSDSRIDTEIAGYRVERLIARGGMSSVYLAHHLRLQRKVALKLMAPELAQDERFRERFLRESQLAASLDHPNVVPIYDADEAAGVLYIAMRFVEGSDLRALLQREGALDPPRALGIVAQAANGLDAAHRRGLVHRDIKPGNILLGEDDHVYLADFGLTKQASSQTGLTATGQLVGTVDYVAPEQIQGQEVDGRTDVYSLACVLFECLAGGKPFDKDSEVAILWAHMQDPPPPIRERRPELPEALESVLEKGMAKKPEDRHATCRDLVEDSRRALGISSGEIPQPVSPQRFTANRKLVAVIAAAAVLAAAFAAILLTRGGSAPVVGRPNAVAVIDTKTNKLVDVVDVGGQPGEVAVSGDSVWVGNTADQTVSHISARTRKVEETIGVGIDPLAIAADEQAVWVSDGDSVVRRTNGFRDTRTTALRDRLNLHFGGIRGAGQPAIALNGDSAWVAHGVAVEHVDGAGTDTVVSRDLQGAVTSIVDALGAVWVADTGAIVHVDRSGNAQRIGLSTGGSTSGNNAAPAGGVTYGAGSIWAASTSEDAVVRIDPVTMTPAARVPVGDRPTGIAYGDGSVWVANTDGTVSRIDPQTNSATTIKVGSSPTGIAVGGRYVWVTLQQV